eukprot:gene741-744_t
MRTSQVLELIPENASFIFEFNNDKGFYDIFKDNKLFAPVIGQNQLDELNAVYLLLRSYADLLITLSCGTGFNPSVLEQLSKLAGSGLVVTPIRITGRQGYNIYINSLKKHLIDQTLKSRSDREKINFTLLSEQQSANSLASLLNYRGDALMFNGKTVATKNMAGYLEIFAGQQPVQNHLKDIFPSTTAYSASFGVSDISKFASDLSIFNDKTVPGNERNRTFNKIKAETGINIKKEFNNLLDTEFAIVNTRFFEKFAIVAFIPDTSKIGDAQSSLKSRIFNNTYDNSALKINQGRYNLVNLNANAYVLMVKMFSSLNGDVEMGISAQTRVEGKGYISDESVAAFNGPQSFSNNAYSNIFNNKYYYQAYNQVSFSYREKITKQFSIGIKASVLMGIDYQKVNITGSNITFDKAADSAILSLKGNYHLGYTAGQFKTRDFLPTFRNPGAAISIGTIYRTEDNFTIQANVKDLGFIHWSSRSLIFNFDDTRSIRGLSTPAREDSIYNKLYKIVRGGPIVGGAFNTPIDGRAEYENYILTLTTTYDDLKTFNIGLQLMYKKPDWEVYIGSDRLTPTAALVGDAINKNSPNITQTGAYTAASIFLGFSYKFGPVS